MTHKSPGLMVSTSTDLALRATRVKRSTCAFWTGDGAVPKSRNV